MVGIGILLVLVIFVVMLLICILLVWFMISHESVYVLIIHLWGRTFVMKKILLEVLFLN